MLVLEEEALRMYMYINHNITDLYYYDQPKLCLLEFNNNVKISNLIIANIISKLSYYIKHYENMSVQYAAISKSRKNDNF